MQIITEAQSAALITHEIAFAAARDALIAAADPAAKVFPAVLAHGSAADNRFSIKSGATADLAGLKVGSFWPGNDALGLPRHNSTILLIDQQVGRIAWAIEAGKVNAYRTAAADAVAADALARADAETLALFGAGHQALYEAQALARVRPIRRVLVVARNLERGAAFVAELAGCGLAAELAAAEDACARADIVVTATSARAPLFEAGWIAPGTHVASMGSDGLGKQELPPELFARAQLFCDLPGQSLAIGEFQHYRGDIARVTAIGEVLSGRAAGRAGHDGITVFDSSGIALQDLYIGQRLVAAFGG